MAQGLRRWQTRQHRFENPDPLVGFVHLRGLNIPRYEKKHRLELSESIDD